MFYLNVWLTVQDSARVEAVANALIRCGEQSRLEDGCMRWEAYQSESNPNCFLLVEHWATKEHWERHRTGPTVTEIYFKEVIPHVTREAHPSRLVI